MAGSTQNFTLHNILAHNICININIYIIISSMPFFSNYANFVQK